MHNIPLKKILQGEADCSRCAFRDSVLFAGLEEKDFEKIHAPIGIFLLPAGATLYRMGVEGQHIHTIRHGLVKLVQYSPEGGRRIVRLLRSTDVAGIETVLGYRYQHDAIMLQSTEVCRIPVELIQRLERDNPMLYRELLSRWQRALTEADTWLTELSTGTSRQRVARLLLKLARDHERHECELFVRDDIGAMLGLTMETASRSIAEFKRLRLLEESGPNRYICDIPALEQIAEN